MKTRHREDSCTTEQGILKDEANAQSSFESHVVRYNLHPRNITTPELNCNCEISTPTMKFLPPGVIIL